MSSKRTITLTDRPPVNINEDAWPMIANAGDKEYDNQYEFQANRISKWFIGVRRHQDGRAIVYATYSYSSAYQGARGYAVKHGVMLPAGTTDADICRAVKDVAGMMAEAEHNGGDASRWPQFANDCIADMPAEEI